MTKTKHTRGAPASGHTIPQAAERPTGSLARPRTIPAPAPCGIGLRPQHQRDLLSTLPRVGFLEVHSENYFCDGGQPWHFLDRLRQHYPVSLHGVGLSLGTTDRLDRRHLARLSRLIDRVEPALVSEHLSWSSVGGRFLNDLLPLPFTEEALAVVCRHVDETQEMLGRRILVENVSSYLRFAGATMTEWEFVAEVATRTGCGILLDLNNIHVAAVNHGFDARVYVDAMPLSRVLELHLAGHDSNGRCLVDTHGTPVAPAVWDLYSHAVRRFGAVPTLVEWDTDIPPLATLLAEAAHADAILEAAHALAA